jgi:hypothetical protein
MIIHFDFSIEELALAIPQQLRQFIAEGIRAHRLGMHVLVLDRAVADYLLTHIDLSDLERAAVQKLRGEFTQTADLVRRSKWHLKVRALPSDTKRVVGNGIEISLDLATNPDVFARTAIVVEDAISDGRFFEFLIQNLRDLFKIPSLQYEVIHGGGERTLEVARSKIEERRIVCVIVDTDKNAYVVPETRKIRALRRLVADRGWPLAFVCPTPCRETENLIPLEVFRILECANGRAATFSTLESIEFLERSGVNIDGLFRLYFDFKLGVSSHSIDRMNGEDEKAWVLERLQKAGVDTQDFALLGFGEQIITQVMRANHACARLRSEVRQRVWLETFGEYISEIMWLCVGGVKQVT